MRLFSFATKICKLVTKFLYLATKERERRTGYELLVPCVFLDASQIVHPQKCVFALNCLFRFQ